MLINYLNDHYRTRITDIVTRLQFAVTDGVVPNVLFKDAKDIINRAFDQGAENFLATGPRQQDHSQSAWWSAAYHADALSVTAHRLLTVIRRTSTVSGLKEYNAFLTSLLPYAQLLEEAKPLVKKRGELPKVKTQKQIEREADCMTCQCCGRGIFAQTGTIAHHGYERPGTGWQTASCMGAKYLPFEVSRDRLGDLIARLERDIEETNRHLRNVRDETIMVPFRWQTYEKAENRYSSGKYVNHTHHFSRADFAALSEEEAAIWDKLGARNFDQLKRNEIESTLGRLRSLEHFLKEQQTRYDGWKQTHTHFDKKAQIWVCR